MTESNNRSLQAINQKIVQPGEVLPEVTLKDGSTVQTGTVATMLYNIELYNQLAAGQSERDIIAQELIQSVPTLIKVGLFKLFSPDEWMSGDNAGRQLIGRTAKKLIDQRN